jgi:glycosyltransferase involved in cell wall biosynthesis
MEKGFTLVIPLYNKVKVCRNTFESVLNNHGEYPFKCIIVDDDSTDGSSEIGEEYDTNYPEIFTYLKIKHHGNKTPVYARNLGIKLADTEYIGFLDADDELCAGFIDRGCNFLDEHPEYNMYGNNNLKYFVNENNETKCEPSPFSGTKQILNTFMDYALALPFIHFCANVYKTSLVKENLFTDNYGEDVVFLYKYIYKNEPVYIDTKINESMIWHVENRESELWNFRRTTHEYYVDEIMECVKNEIPDFRYGLNRIGETLYLYVK